MLISSWTWRGRLSSGLLWGLVWTRYHAREGEENHVWLNADPCLDTGEITCFFHSPVYAGWLYQRKQMWGQQLNQWAKICMRVGSEVHLWKTIMLAPKVPQAESQHETSVHASRATPTLQPICCAAHVPWVSSMSSFPVLTATVGQDCQLWRWAPRWDLQHLCWNVQKGYITPLLLMLAPTCPWKNTSPLPNLCLTTGINWRRE